jgi:hypothetical protein
MQESTLVLLPGFAWPRLIAAEMDALVAATNRETTQVPVHRDERPDSCLAESSRPRLRGVCTGLDWLRNDRYFFERQGRVRREAETQAALAIQALPWAA